jgi:hypothetical protein
MSLFSFSTVDSFTAIVVNLPRLYAIVYNICVY